MNDKDTVVVPREARNTDSLVDMARLRITRARRIIHQHTEVADEDLAVALDLLAAAPSTSVREEEIEAALRECAKPYFWDADGFWPDASTPAHKQAEMERRQRLARAALKPSTDKGGEE